MKFTAVSATHVGAALRACLLIQLRKYRLYGIHQRVVSRLYNFIIVAFKILLRCVDCRLQGCLIVVVKLIASFLYADLISSGVAFLSIPRIS